MGSSQPRSSRFCSVHTARKKKAMHVWSSAAFCRRRESPGDTERFSRTPQTKPAKEAPPICAMSTPITNTHSLLLAHLVAELHRGARVSNTNTVLFVCAVGGAAASPRSPRQLAPALPTSRGSPRVVALHRPTLALDRTTRVVRAPEPCTIHRRRRRVPGLRYSAVLVAAV
jgi:hypothetical protein